MPVLIVTQKKPKKVEGKIVIGKNKDDKVIVVEVKKVDGGGKTSSSS